jgi:hypothetical protein
VRPAAGEAGHRDQKETGNSNGIHPVKRRLSFPSLYDRSPLCGLVALRLMKESLENELISRFSVFVANFSAGGHCNQAST